MSGTQDDTMPRARGADVSVLIIEDEARLRYAWAEYLEADGLLIRVASSGREGVRIARSEPIDVVITDIYMPEKDGIETLREIKDFHAGTKVVVVTGGGSRLKVSFLDAAQLLGADATFTKPVDLKRLSATVRQLATSSAPRPAAT